MDEKRTVVIASEAKQSSAVPDRDVEVPEGSDRAAGAVSCPKALTDNRVLTRFTEVASTTLIPLALPRLWLMKCALPVGECRRELTRMQI